MNLRTRYLGLELEHPLVASAGPLSKTLDGIRALEDGGAAAIVLFSLFEEDIRRENEARRRLSSQGSESFLEAMGYLPAAAARPVGPDAYLRHLNRAVEAVDVPVIASLNGTTPGGWTEYARLLEGAGARALELNLFRLPLQPALTSAMVEDQMVQVVGQVREVLSIPLSVKLGPWLSAPASLAHRLVEAGADGLVLFNRFYQPDFDLDRMEVVHDLELSTPGEMRLPLLWISVLSGGLGADVAASTGVDSGREVVKYLLAGATAVMTTSALIRRGPGRCRGLVEELERWMAERGHDSVDRFRGAMRRERVADPGAFERLNYLRVLQSYRVPEAWDRPA